MSASRTKNAARNILFGFVNRFVLLFLPFLTRTLILRLLGATFLGVGTLFSSILSFLSLAELGLDSAIVYTMYRPIAENDGNSICALLKYYKKLYRKIGFIILLIGSALVPFLPILINGTPPESINIYLLYYIYLIESAIGYFFFGYKRCLIVAHQRSDINSNINSILSLVIQSSKILVLYLTNNFYVYAAVPVIGTLLSNLSTAIITNKMYPQYVPRGEIDENVRLGIKKKLVGMLGTRLNSIVVHSADIMIISAFWGLSLTAKYGNYYYIMNSVCGFVAILSSSMTAGIGNKLVTDSSVENYKLFNNLTFMNSWIVGWFSVCLLCLFEPFVELWLGKEMQLGITFVVFFVFYFFIYEIQRTMLSFKTAMGLWHKDQIRPYISMVVNIVLNFLLIHLIGIYGVVISTAIAYFLSLPWINHIIYKNGFPNNNPLENIKNIFVSFLITVIACLLSFIACQCFGNSLSDFLIKIFLCIIIPNVIFFLCYRKRNEFNFFVSRLKLALNRRIIHKKR